VYFRMGQNLLHFLFAMSPWQVMLSNARIHVLFHRFDLFFTQFDIEFTISTIAFP